MAVIENRFVCDLAKPVQAQALKGNVFSLDNLGSRISVLIYDNGQPATISGSVTANCILPDGSTVNVNGSMTTENGGSKAYVDVPQSCLLIPGILKIAIKCTSSSVITTLAAIVANVYMTKTDNVITPSAQIISDWNAEISAQLASAVKFSSQSLTDTQKATARSNISAASSSELQAEATARATADTTLQGNIDAEAATRAAADADLKSALYTDYVRTTMWGQGKYAVSSGSYSSDSKLIYSYKYVPTPYVINAVGFRTTDTYEFSILCWKRSDDTYMGSWTGSGFNKSSNTFFRRPVYFSEIGSEYKFAFNVRNRNTSTAVTTAEATNMYFITTAFVLRNQGTSAVGKIPVVNADGYLDMSNDLINIKTSIENNLPHEVQLKTKSELATGNYIDTGVGSNWTNGLVSSSGSIYTSSAIDVSEYVGDNIIIEIGSTDSHTGVRESGFCNSSNIVSSIITEGNLSFKSENSKLRARIPITDNYFFFSCSSKTSLTIYVDAMGEVLKIATTDVRYVATTGSDSNNGSYANPFATVNKALESGAKRVCVKSGTYSQRINLSLTKHGAIDIVNSTPTEKVVFMSPDCVVSNSETAVEGYERVYSLTTSKTFSTNNIWLFQNGVPDALTEITSAKRMPEQRGQAYRCYDTRIIPCNSTTLADALTEIENDTTYYRWFKDGTTIYFSRPSEVSESNPICGSFNTALFSNASRRVTLNVSGIDVKYMRFNADNTSHSRICDCSVSNVFADGAITFDGADEIEFIRCETARAYSGENGDGFNAHSSNTGDAFAHQTTATLIDCWSHDNRDDGISTHERSEVTIIGGLFERNYWGGGVTPANGAHFTCYNVYSRDNGDGGFLYMNPTAEAEGGVGGQIKCIGCVSESNNINSSATMGGYKVNSAGNKAILIGCKALNEYMAFYVARSDSDMILIDCGAYNCTYIKGGQTEKIVAQNTTIVT